MFEFIDFAFLGGSRGKFYLSSAGFRSIEDLKRENTPIVERAVFSFFSFSFGALDLVCSSNLLRLNIVNFEPPYFKLVEWSFYCWVLYGICFSEITGKSELIITEARYVTILLKLNIPDLSLGTAFALPSKLSILGVTGALFDW